MPDSLDRHIARAAKPLPALAELGEANEALCVLSDMVGGARIVAIGESFHHTHEQLVLREHLVRHLVSQLGFNVLLLEVITPGPNALDDFARGGGGDAESALITAGARMWRNRETVSLMNWLRRQNLTCAARPVCVRGLDVMAIGPPMRAVVRQLQPAEAPRVITLSRAFDIDGRADQVAYNQLGADDRALLHRLFGEAFLALSTRASAFRQSMCEAAHETALEQALVVLQALEMLKAGARVWTDGFALRDAAMAGAVTRLVDRADRGDKFVILSHNTHIAAIAPHGELAHAPMGAHLKRRYGKGYFALGTAFGSAHFDPPVYGVSDFTGEPGTADQHIAALGHACALVDLRPTDQDQPLRLQGVGLGPATYTEYPRLDAFDALAYVDTLTNAQQLVDTELTMDAKAVDATRQLRPNTQSGSSDD